ncbi:hypothetical protein [Streptomyces sp. NPDC058545]|uniref:hypothetical protein n=1 Tax=Streptomyces sp. NPDC058545 TaxID=3346544 RepID=UPI00365AF33E
MNSLYPPRMTGRPGRLEVWYATLTDPRTGTGVWIHHEVVAPRHGDPARAHGWISVFPPDGPPVTERFGVPDSPPPHGEAYFEVPGVRATPQLLEGTAGAITWRLTVTGGGEPLYTFPRWSWQRELLPAAQIVPAPDAIFDGELVVGERRFTLSDAVGGVARIAGHGNAQRWAWLHAGLGGGDVLEVVAAVARRPTMRWLPPLPMLQLRIGGTDWPRDPLLTAPLLRARIGLPAWSVAGGTARRRVRIDVTQDPADCVSLSYTDPDGATATCTNTERATVDVIVERRTGLHRFEVEHRWHLDRTGHAEVGTRP